MPFANKSQAAIEDLFENKPEQYTPDHYALFSNFKAALNAGEIRAAEPDSKEASGWLLGRQLVKLGYVSETDLKQVISKQTCEIVVHIWRDHKHTAPFPSSFIHCS